MHFTMYVNFIELLAELGPEAAAKKVKEMGFESVEVLESTAPGHPTVIPDVDTARRVRQIFEAEGLHFACYSVGTNLYHAPENEASLCRHAEIACALGAPYLHHTSLPGLVLTEDSPAFEEAITVAADAAARVANYAATLGLTCIYEDQGMYVNGIEGFGRFLAEMKKRCSNVGVCADTGNIMFADETPAPFFEAFKDDIKHVHFKDYLWAEGPESPGRYWLPTKGGHFVRPTWVGDGVIDLEACMKVLKSIGYDGALAYEADHPEPYEEGVKQAMAHMRRFF